MHVYNVYTFNYYYNCITINKIYKYTLSKNRKNYMDIIIRNILQMKI